MYANRVSGGVNRNGTTDFAAPAFNVPTFRRTFSPTTATATSSGVAGDPLDHLTFNQVGTSMSAAIVTGAYALVSSALNYWITLAQSNGYTADAYLTTPVGVNSLNFGAHVFKNLSAWNNPSGINGILAWTAVPATDANDGGSLSTPPNLPGSTNYRSYASINVANAVAAIEGYVAINYLLKHNIFPIIDVNHDGLITAQELQGFVNNSAQMGMQEAGAMAALLGGTATYSAVQPGLNNEVFNENPDQPAAEQRRFNFFNYAVDGELTGGITINQYKMLSRILLPSPDAYTITDRQRASANGFLLAPTTPRNFIVIQHTQPSFLWVPPSAVKKYRNISPARFHVGRGQRPGTYFPLYTLFSPTVQASGNSTPPQTVVTKSKSANVNGVPITVNWVTDIPSPHVSTSTSQSTAATSSTATPYVSVTKPTTTVPPVSAPTTTPSQTTPAQATPLDSLLNLVNGTTSSGTTGSSSTAAATTGQSTDGTTTAPSASGTTPTTTTATPTATSGTGTPAATAPTVSPTVAATPPPQAATGAAKPKAKTKKSSTTSNDFWNKLWTDVSKPFK